MTHPTNWHSHEFYAMGSHMSVLLESDDDEKAAASFAKVVAAFEQAEQRMSRFRADSELCWLNSQAGRWAEVSQPLWNVLIEALDLATETDGLFDPTLHNAIVAAGYNRTFTDLSPTRPDQLQATNAIGRWREIAVDPANRALYMPDGVQLDLGGIGKGFTARTVAGWLSETGACLVNAGGDLTAGTAPTKMPGWPVGIAAPWEQGQTKSDNLMRLWLANGALATSGIDYRQWLRDGQPAHHIIDPRTGISAETDLLTCSIISADACRAEAWATATLIAGLDAGYETLSQHNIAATLIDQHGNIKLTPAMRPLVQFEQDAELRLI